MIKCPSCGHENVDGTQFCEMCGEELAAVAKASAAPGAGGTADAAAGGAAPAGMVKCPACDNLNPADNVVCEVCGTELKKGALSITPDAGPSTTPFDTPAQSPSASTATSASTAASAPTPAAADTATSTDTDASMPTVSISSADPLSNDPLTSDPIAATTPAATVPAATVPALDTPAAMAPAAAPTASASGGVLEPGKVRLVVEQGMTVGKQFVLGDTEVLVGREDEEDGIYPDIDLSDQDEGYVHRRHAVLKFENGGLSVTHLGGANKTRVNNKPLADNAPQSVSIGDKVAFGKVVMRVQSN